MEILTVGYLLRRTADKAPANEVVGSRKRIPYADFDRRANQLAHTLISWGVGKGDPVALLMPNIPELGESIFGITRCGAVCLPLNYRLKTHELIYILQHSGSKVIIYEQGFSDPINLLKGQTGLEKFIRIGGSGQDPEYESLLNHAPETYPFLEVGENDPAALLYTSGTTGRPKGVILTQRNVLWSCVSQAIEYRVTSRDKILIAPPMFHVGAFFRFLSAVYLGNSVFLMDQFDPIRFLEIIHKNEITFTALVPTMFIMVDQLPEEVKRSYKTTSVTKYITSGSILPVDLVRRIQKLFPNAEIRDSYGATECNFVTILQPQDLIRKLGSIGKANVNSEVKILNDQGEEVGPGIVGEICVRSPQVLKEYYKDPEATREAYKYGWFHIGDMGKTDDEGFIYIVDRKKDMIISGGENIYPREIEELLYTHEKIVETAVIGVPDPLWGESVRAIIVTKPGEKLTAEEVIQFCARQLAGYKKPKSVIFVDSLPKNPSNKILKRILKEQYGKS